MRLVKEWNLKNHVLGIKIGFNAQLEPPIRREMAD